MASSFVEAMKDFLAGNDEAATSDPLTERIIGRLSSEEIEQIRTMYGNGTLLPAVHSFFEARRLSQTFSVSPIARLSGRLSADELAAVQAETIDCRRRGGG